MAQYPDTIDDFFLATLMRKKTNNELAQKFGFKIIGFGGGCSGGVQELSLDGNKYGYLSEEEARLLIVESALIFRNNINRVRILRPWLCSYPFPIDRIDLSFYLKDPILRGKLPLGVLSSIRLSYGRLLFGIATKQDCLHTYKEESFEEALRIVEQERKEQGLPSLLVAPSQLQDITLPRDMPEGKEHHAVPEEAKLFRFLLPESKRIAEESGLKFACRGDFSAKCRGVYYGIVLYGFEKFSLNESQNFVRDFFKKYYTFLQQSPEIKEFQRWRRADDIKIRKELEELSKNKSFQDWKLNKGEGVPLPEETPLLSEIPLKITFWDKSFNPQLPPHIAQITFLKEVFSFYQADPITHELTCVFEVPYEKLMKETNQK